MINAIVDDLNKNRIPDSRMHELLHENNFESNTEYAENVEIKDIVISRTFLAYALPKINNLQDFLEKLKTTLGKKEFEGYMRETIYGGDTPFYIAIRKNKLDGVKAILETDSIDRQKLFGIKDNNNSTPLYFILKHNNLELLKEILNESKDNPDLLRKILSENYLVNIL